MHLNNIDVELISLIFVTAAYCVWLIRDVIKHMRSGIDSED